MSDCLSVATVELPAQHRAAPWCRFELLLGIGTEFGALFERTFLRLHILVSAHDDPVNILHLIHGRENLLPECGVGDAAIENGFINEAVVDPDSRTLEQVLGHFSLEAR